MLELITENSLFPTRCHLLASSARALATPVTCQVGLGARRRPRRRAPDPQQPGSTGCRCLATSNIRKVSSISTTSIRTPPQGGAVRQLAFGTFDNFNLVVSGVKGQLATGLEPIYDSR